MSSCLPGNLTGSFVILVQTMFNLPYSIFAYIFVIGLKNICFAQKSILPLRWTISHLGRGAMVSSQRSHDDSLFLNSRGKILLQVIRENFFYL